MNRKQLGDVGENAACEFLRQQGYLILATKYRSKTGEIDIIAREQNEIGLVFVEVKTRRSLRCGFPAEAVNNRKQQKLMNTALCYLQACRQEDIPCRFDVIEIYITNEKIAKYNHIKDAFAK